MAARDQPYYDSLLVKLTAWGREFPQACQRMTARCASSGIRVKTNIPFLENVVIIRISDRGE
jgi:pyruvate carboxylase